MKPAAFSIIQMITSNSFPFYYRLSTAKWSKFSMCHRLLAHSLLNIQLVKLSGVPAVEVVEMRLHSFKKIIQCSSSKTHSDTLCITTYIFVNNASTIQPNALIVRLHNGIEIVIGAQVAMTSFVSMLSVRIIQLTARIFPVLIVPGYFVRRVQAVNLSKMIMVSLCVMIVTMMIVMMSVVRYVSDAETQWRRTYITQMCVVDLVHCHSERTYKIV